MTPGWLAAERNGSNSVGPGSDWGWLAWLDEIEMADARWFDQHGQAAPAEPEPAPHVVPLTRPAAARQGQHQDEGVRHAAA